MSDKILDALMQLFAILANAERFSVEGRKIVESFLNQQISRSYVEKYLALFDTYLETLRGKASEGKVKKRLSVNSVKVLRICTDINKELDTRQKHIVLIRLIEFVYASENDIDEQEKEFLNTVAEVFHITPDDLQLCMLLATFNDAQTLSDSPKFLLLSSRPPDKLFQQLLYQSVELLNGMFCFLNLKSAGLMLVRYQGTDSFMLNGLPMNAGSCYVFSSGSVIRGARMNTIYYSDIIRLFSDIHRQQNIRFEVNHIYYKFANGKIGLHDVTFSAASGNLVGIMGGSGAGKSTLLNILNGNNRPSKGEVLINGLNLHHQSDKLEGIIGYVPQDDLLMEDLSVYQNLYYNAKLCFGNISNNEIEEKVEQVLKNVGLFEARHLRVGDALHTTISGGQRKRLNIALELIRAPEVLFVDEPTSGLSSLDSENVMDLLKQLTIQGKLVFVVIHQPSSDIFKMFDKLLVLDRGGYPAYFGNPLDSIIYFKQKAAYADADDSQCGTCGNINPEQIFTILESKVMDEFGNLTDQRKLTPGDWYELYLSGALSTNSASNASPLPVPLFKKPSWLKQLQVFITRDVLAKLKNTQYLLITFLEAPVLAFILAWFLKYAQNGQDYIFKENKNLAAFIFMGVIVAVFMGLMVSAEEIIRDRKILKREQFLNLSRSSYLWAKILIMFFISALQTLSFACIANWVFGIEGMTADYWVMLFSASCFANLLGLNVSSAFDSVVTIYILIPFLIIPQIILSGVMVKFEDLNPAVTSQSKVPLIGELMVSKWAFEALAVNQFKNNEYQKCLFEYDRLMSQATYKKDFWLQKVSDVFEQLSKGKSLQAEADKQLLKNELLKELRVNKTVSEMAGINAIEKISNDAAYFKVVSDTIRNYYIRQYNLASRQKDSVVKVLGNENLIALKNRYTNENIENLLLNKNDFSIIIRDENSLIQRFQPVYMPVDPGTSIRSALYVADKNVLGYTVSTWYLNLVVIWSMTVALMVMLYFNIFNRIIHALGKISFNRRI